MTWGGALRRFSIDVKTLRPNLAVHNKYAVRIWSTIVFGEVLYFKVYLVYLFVNNEISDIKLF